MRIGDRYTSPYLGAAVMNTVIVVSVLGVCGLLALARHRSNGVTFPVAATTVMFPGMASSIDGYFKQAIVGCLFFVVWYDDRAVVCAVCGMMLVLYGVAGAVFLWVMCFRWVPAKAEHVDGVWRDRPAHEGFVGQFGFAFSTFRAGCEWFPFVDYAVMVVFGVVSSITPLSTAHCLANIVIYEVILLAKLCLYVRFRPRIVPLVNVLTIGVTLMECLGAAVSIVRHAALPGEDVPPSMRTVLSLLVLLASLFVGASLVAETWLRWHEVTTAPGPSLDETEMHPTERHLMPRTTPLDESVAVPPAPVMTTPHPPANFNLEDDDVFAPPPKRVAAAVSKRKSKQRAPSIEL